MSSRRPCAECGHRENEHRGNGACIAFDGVLGQDATLCPCNDYVPGREQRTPLSSSTERSRAHERRMRALRPVVMDQARGRCQCGLSTSPPCDGFASVIHHRWPTEKGGPDQLDNLVAVCGPCHDWIHNQHPDVARTLGFLRDRL